MPFQSEKQRRYLWANEPEIARDWADTYGSRIQKNDGGVMSVQGGVKNYLGDQKTVSGVPIKWQSGPNKPDTELAYITKAEKDLILKKDLHGSLKNGPNTGPEGIISLDSQGDKGTYGQTGQSYGDRQTSDTSPEVGDRGGGYQDSGYEARRRAREKDPFYGTKHAGKEKLIAAQKAKEKKFKKSAKIRNITSKGTLTQKALYGLLKNNPTHALQYLSTIKDKDEEVWNDLPQELKDLIGPGTFGEADPSGMDLYSSWESHPELSYDQFSMLSQVPGYGQYLKDRGKPGVLHSGNVGGLGDRFVQKDKFGTVMKDKFGNTLYGYGRAGGGGQGGGYMGYPSYAAWKAAQGQGGGGGTTEVAEVVEDTPSAFQASLTTGASSPFDYYVGQNPTAKNLAWGETYGADPRTMGLTSWAADGGRIGRAYGGIMDSSTGRRAYGFGSFFKKIGRAAKKVIKSPIGKAALVAGLGYGANAGWFGGGMKGWVPGLKQMAMDKKWLGNMLLNKDRTGWSLGKLGILGAGALPFFMGGQDEDEDEGFDYEGAKNKYWDELMRIKAGTMAGSLDPNQWSYLPSNYTFTGAKGGRARYYKGGQSIPSDYTMEDAVISTTQDKLGGITDVMKQADIFRSGDVGQFYAANGGRIGYGGGGQTGHPPITTGQVSQIPPQAAAPQAPPMPAPQANPMAKGMNPMGGGMPRRMAQEGGLMDLGGMEKDYRQEGGFVPLGGEEKADDVPARLSKNEFVFTADAVRGAGGGDIDKGAEIMENVMKNLEQGGQVSEETQGLSGAQEMFGVSERLSEVV